MPRTPISFTFGNTGVISIRPEWQFTNTSTRDQYFSNNPGELKTLRDSSKAGVFLYIKTGSQFQYNDPITDNWITDSKIIQGHIGHIGVGIKSIRLKDGTTDTYEVVLTDGNIAGEFNLPTSSLIRMFGTEGRLVFKESNNHFIFEVLDNGSWVTKFEVGSSAIVDSLRLIEGSKPSNIATNELAIYNKKIILPDGTKTVRPEVVRPDGHEFGFVYNDQQHDNLVYRKIDGTLGYAAKLSDLQNVQFDKSIDGGVPESVYTTSQQFDGGVI